MLSRILVPLDGSPASTEVLGAVRQLVGGTGAVVHLLLVRPPLRGAVQRGDRTIYVDELVREEEAAGRDYLAREGSELAFDGVVVRRAVRFGDPLAETLHTAARYAVQLIAVAAPPQTRAARLLRPSLADQLGARAAVPLLTVVPARASERDVAWRYSSVPA